MGGGIHGVLADVVQPQPGLAGGHEVVGDLMRGADAAAFLTLAFSAPAS
jgi:hypothetical protein